MPPVLNTNAHRVSIVDPDNDRARPVRIRPGKEVDVGEKLYERFLALDGVVAADSAEADAWHAENDPPEAEGRDLQIEDRQSVADHALTERLEHAKRNRRVVGDPDAPGGPQGGVITARGDRPVDPAIATTSSEAQAEAGGLDLSDEPELGELGLGEQPSGPITSDRVPSPGRRREEAASVPPDPSEDVNAGDGDATEAEAPAIDVNRANKPELEAEVERRRAAGESVSVTGTGQGGAVTVKDLRRALK